VLRQAAHPNTAEYFLAALDLHRNADGNVARVPEERRIYLQLFGKTFALSALITVLCLMLAFPIAHLLSALPPARSNLLMILVLLPFWTSLLVRTSSWIALLQGQGVVNDLLVSTGLIQEGHRLDMMYNRTGTVIVMTHILLPFMVLPLYSVMRSINPGYVRAALSLGASSWVAFRRVYLPLTRAGVAAGCLLVFILSIGYFVTPALVGGADGQLISNLIQFHMNNSNWPLAAALSTLLLVSVFALYWVYDRVVGINNLRLG
jgi:putative spermidine/putrescine transport system permease protein